MTEPEWLACEAPETLLGYSWDSWDTGTMAGRKARLVMCALARARWDDLGNIRSREAVEEAEAVADGAGDWDEMARVAAAARRVQEQTATAFVEAITAARGKWRKYVKDAARRADAAAVAAWAANSLPLGFLRTETTWDGPGYFYDETLSIRMVMKAELDLLREVYCNPSATPRIEQAWLRWENGTALKLAGQIYDTRRYEELPVLSDALEEAGCTDADILSHLRSPGPHVRGCWALDLVLGKE